jgi:hypothetical protein
MPASCEVFIVCPAHTMTGGPELCHQLADTLNADQPGRAAIVYWPFDKPAATADPYRCYDAPAARRCDIHRGAIVVLPETYGRLICDFPHNQIYYWWMSVNNFYTAAGTGAGIELAQIRRHATVNLYQSEYARRFCAAAGLHHTSRLSDRLSESFLHAIADPPQIPRRDIIAYNPAKGLARTAAVLRALDKGLRPPPKVIALENLDTDQLRTVLGTVKIYIDFGEHPGKDRLPREAAAMGACILTNRRGAAGNNVDMPIPEEFKIDDQRRGWEYRAVGKIHQLVKRFDIEAPRFGPYRRMIAAEPRQFANDARLAFAARVPA